MGTKFEVGQRYPTRNGGEALVLDVDQRGFLVVARYTSSGTYSGVYGCDESGRRPTASALSHGWDILPPEPEKRVVWANVGRNAQGVLYLRGDTYGSRYLADAHHSELRVGCHRIELRAEFEDDAS